MAVAIIAPVGIYVGRVIRGILEKLPSGIQKIYLLTQAGDSEWARKTRENLSVLMERLGPLRSLTEHVEVEDFTAYEKCFSTLYDIVKRLASNNNVREILVDITSSTRMWTVAATAVASLFENVRIYYVKKSPSKDQTQIEERYPKWAVEDEGDEIVEIVPPLANMSDVLSDAVAKKILILLYTQESKKRVSSLKDLAVSLELISPRDPFPKRDKIKLRRKLSKLREKGLIYLNQYTGRALDINLTLLGRMIAQILMDEKEEKLL
ncbi:MAG: DUF6293 family protein [Candidatus Asgardarchaeia archaeon]